MYLEIEFPIIYISILSNNVQSYEEINSYLGVSITSIKYLDLGKFDKKKYLD